MSEIRNETLKKLSAGERSIAFLFSVIPGNHTASTLEDYVRVASGRPPNRAAIVEILKGLVEAGVFEEGISAKGVQDAAYRVKGTYELKVLQALAQEATKRGWWPAPRIIAGGLAGSWLGSEFSYALRNFVDSTQVWQVAEALRTILVGGVSTAFATPPGARYSIASVHWAAVTRLLNLLGDGAVLPGDNLSPRALDSLLPTMLEVGFLRRADIRSLLETTRGLVAIPGARPSQTLLCTCCALSVWTGRRDLLRGFAGFMPVDSPAARFALVCRDVFEGRFEEAAKAFAQGADDVRSARPTEVATPVWLLGLALALGTGDASAHAAKYAQELNLPMPPLNDWHPLARQAIGDAQKERARLVQGVMGAATQKNGTPAAILLRGERDPLQTPKQFFVAGYPTLALVLTANVRAALPNEPHSAEFEVILVRNNAVRLFRTSVNEPAWKKAMDALDDCLPKKGAVAKAEVALNGTIGWELTLTAPRADLAGLCSCQRLVPFYRGPRGAADGSDDHALTLRALASAKYRACLTACDAEALQVLLKTGYNAHAPGGVPDDALELLCGHPRLVVHDVRSAPGEHAPMTLTRRPCALSTARNARGEMVLELPEWIFASTTATFAIRRLDEGVYEYNPLPKGVRDIVGVFSTHGLNGRLIVPREGLSLARGVLERLAGLMSVGGDFAVAAGGSDFTRVAGDVTPHVRLVYANEALSLALVVEPLPNRAVAACEPGIGLAERLVQLRGGKTVLLVRDLAAETKAAEPVRAALEMCEPWATGQNRWLISNAETALNALRTLRMLGDVRLDWPEGEKLRVAAPSAGGSHIEASGTDWFSIGGEIALDDGRVMKLLDVLRALENREGNYVRFGERDFIFLSGELMRRMEALAAVVTTSGEASGEARVAAAAVPMLARAFTAASPELPSLPEAMRARATEIETAFAAPVETPRRFRGTLRPYQEVGFAWLEHLAACGFGACLADDMGLGKTIQMLALLLKRAAEGASLVIAPASVCVNWMREIARFTPTLRARTFDDGETPLADLGAGDVVVASYGLLVAHADDFAAVDWNGVILDEAQAVKNAATQRARAACRLKAKFRVASTGTPIENRLSEFWSIFSFLNPGLLGTAHEFERRFSEAGFATRALKRIVEPFVLRRLKRDVLRDLPEKTEITLRVALDDAERSAYEACRRMAREELVAKGETKNHVSILAALTRLRRFCCHPSLVMPDMAHSTKLDAILDLLDELHAGGHRALVFSQFVDYLALVRDAITARGWTCRYLDGSTPTAERMDSVDAFQRGDGDFFLISLRAGGTGINLTAANYVLLLDPWWNPAVEDQAADRVHRIGQKLPVTVYRVVAENTVEDRILDMHGDKRAVSDDLLEAAHGAPLSSERLMALFEEN